MYSRIVLRALSKLMALPFTPGTTSSAGEIDRRHVVPADHVRRNVAGNLVQRPVRHRLRRHGNGIGEGRIDVVEVIQSDAQLIVAAIGKITDA